jgi:putative transcriptional regulator
MNTPVSHHPKDELLLEFSAGSLDSVPAMCVSAHLHFCERCRAKVSQLNELGSELFSEQHISEQHSLAVDDDALARLFDRIDATPSDASDHAPAQSSNLPHVVEKLLSASQGPTWKKLSNSLDIARLVTGQNKFEVALHRICAGGKTPTHNHSGKEYTVVLSGSFSDEDGIYRPGDFLIRRPGESHQPMGAQNGECICFSALESPIRFPGLLGWLARPFLRLHPA